MGRFRMSAPNRKMVSSPGRIVSSPRRDETIAGQSGDFSQSHPKSIEGLSEAQTPSVANESEDVVQWPRLAATMTGAAGAAMGEPL
jgi:hypothetical protein